MINQKKTNGTFCSQQYSKKKYFLGTNRLQKFQIEIITTFSSTINKCEMLIQKIHLKFRCKSCFVVPSFKIQGTDPFKQPRSLDWKSRGRPRL